MTILIVDDNPVNLFVIEKILKQAGYRDNKKLTSAQQLFDYLQLETANASATPVDLILLDIMMPEIDGLEACRRIQQDERFKDIPVIFVTALEDANKLAEALDVGAVDYITKPINKVELLARIRVALRLKAELNWHIEHDKIIKNELDLATHVQRNLLSVPVQEKDITIDVAYLPSFKLAGDMYYWDRIDDARYGIILFDMMGHGISASLVCMYISSVLREAMKELVDPELVMKELNRYMATLHNEKDAVPYYFTAIYMVVDMETKTVSYINAGHPAGFALIDGKEVKSLEGGSCAIGFFDDIVVETSTLSFEQDIQLLLFTDGVLETIAATEVEAEGKLRAVTATRWENPSAMLRTFFTEEEKAQQTDDMCVVTIQAKAKSSISV